MEMVVKALDAEWHDECFACVECGAGFEDGRVYVRTVLREEGPGRVKREREVEMPVCGACEGRRLKNIEGGWI
jgi:paxillin